MGVNCSSVEGRVRGLSENYLGFRALEFRPLNPVSVGLRIRAQLECHFLVRNSLPVNLKSSVNCASPSLAPTFTPTDLFLLLLFPFLLPFRGSSFNYFFKVDRASTCFQIIFIPSSLAEKLNVARTKRKLSWDGKF